MKNILKTIAVLVSASLISVAAKAGELTVTGSAKASYVMGSGFNDNGKAIGISNELNFTASGELDKNVEMSIIGSTVQKDMGVIGAVPEFGCVANVTFWLEFVIGISQLFGSAASTNEVILKVTDGTAAVIVGHNVIGLPVVTLFPLLSIVKMLEDVPFASTISMVIL